MTTIGFAFSGGGARGVAHLGMIKAMSEAGIKPSVISGTSAGSIVATLYASGYEPDEILEFVVNTKVMTALRPSLNFKGFLRIDTLGEIMKKHLPSTKFEDLKIPTIISATDIIRGESVYFEKGDMILPIMASCCVPVFFSPVIIGKRVFVDGGVLDNLPAHVIKSRCDFVIGFHTNPITEYFEMKSLKSVIERSLIMAINGNTSKSKVMCDFVIEPMQLGDYGGFDLGKSQEMFDIGYSYAKSKIDSLKKKLDQFAKI